MASCPTDSHGLGRRSLVIRNTSTSNSRAAASTSPQRKCMAAHPWSSVKSVIMPLCSSYSAKCLTPSISTLTVPTDALSATSSPLEVQCEPSIMRACPGGGKRRAQIPQSEGIVEPQNLTFDSEFRRALTSSRWPVLQVLRDFERIENERLVKATSSRVDALRDREQLVDST